MPDVREVFRMSTQKVKPEPGFVDRQHDHRHTRERRRKIGAFVVVAAIGLAALVVILTTRPEGNRTKPADTPSSPTTVSVPIAQPFLLDLGSGMETPLSGGDVWGVFYTASPDGSQLVYGHCCTGNDMVTVANIDGTGAHAITPTDLDGYGPAWSPDGSELVYQLRDSDTMKFGSLVVEDVGTGETTRLATIHGRDPWWFMSPTFSPDGSTVLFHVPRPSSDVWDVWSVPVSGGEPTLVLRNAKFARYFPDGKEIAFVAGRSSDLEGPRISIASADGARRTLVEADVSIFRPSVSPDGTRIAYSDGSSIFVVDVSTGEAADMGYGASAEWLDDDTLIVSPQ
jgi:Tol biopolymer transport system component